MKRKFSLTAAIMAALLLSANAQQTAHITPSGIGYLQYLPDGYHSNSNNYPVVIFLHGAWEKGTSSTDPNLVKRDLSKVDNVGLARQVKQGKKYPFILISPQLKSKYGNWPAFFIIEVLNHVKKQLRIDNRRIYLTGLSLGGGGTWRTAGEYPHVFAAIAPICGGNAMDKAHAIAAENVAVWAFHGGSDRIVSYTLTTKMVNAINSAPKRPDPLAKVTIFPNVGHYSWDKAYNDTNLLTWMLGFRNGSRSTSESSNTPPVADAGNDQTVSLPSNSVHLKGKGADQDGKVVSYQWTKRSGGNARMDGTAHEELNISDLSQGTYVFRLTVKDDDGASAWDEAKVIVKPSGNKAPVVNAGGDRTVTLPTNSITLEGSASDADGDIASYKWTKISGANARLEQTSSRSFSVSALTEGEYVFRLTVKDNDGASASDEVKVTVKTPANKAPVVNAGGDRTITFPTNTITLEGTASDADGKVTAYQWTKISGGNARLGETTTPVLTASNLAEGSYVFRLTVKDNDGASAADDIRVTVKEAQNKRPLVNAGTDKSITLPTHSLSLQGSASDEDGDIVAYRWTKISGGAANLNGVTGATLSLSDLVEGTYLFRFSAKDNDGAVSWDDVSVTVTKRSSANKPPVVNAGSDRTLRFPANRVNLQGSATDEDGSIASYEWAQISGATATVSDVHAEIFRLSDLNVGAYVFRLTVTDNNGATNSDEVNIYITEGWGANIQPVDYDGNERTTDLPFDISNPFNEALNGGNN